MSKENETAKQLLGVAIDAKYTVHIDNLSVSLDRDKKVLYLSPSKTERTFSQSEVDRLIRQARADQLKKLWNATQHDIVPEGTPALDMSEELHKMIKELEEIK